MSEGSLLVDKLARYIIAPGSPFNADYDEQLINYILCGEICEKDYYNLLDCMYSKGFPFDVKRINRLVKKEIIRRVSFHPDELPLLLECYGSYRIADDVYHMSRGYPSN